MKYFCTTIIVIAAINFAITVSADVILPQIINSKMVLQQGTKVPIWGWADKGEEITVKFAGQTQKTVPKGPKNRWEVKLAPLKASSLPQLMTIEGKNKITLVDVLVGEVWLASGQSNMEMILLNTDRNEKNAAKAESNNKMLRFFDVERIMYGVPLDDTSGHWKTCSQISKNLRASAVGFFFGLALQKNLGVPVAIIDSNWGGKKIERFISDDGYTSIKLKPHRSRQWQSGSLAKKLKTDQETLKKLGCKAVAAADKGLIMPIIFLNRMDGHANNSIYNGMIAPLVPYAIKGVIWYQGESNRGRKDYFKKLQGLSLGWAKSFNIKDIPLYQVQIAPYDYTRGKSKKCTVLCDTIWKAQYKGANEIPGMGIVAIHDTNINIKSIHPRHKRTVGERLAAMALKRKYGKNIVASGPRFASAKLSGNKVIVSFSEIDKGLTTKDSKAPTWFELSADGKVFMSAKANIIANTVEVSCKKLPLPKFVRMGWNEIAIPNLMDKNGWPAFAFSGKVVK